MQEIYTINNYSLDKHQTELINHNGNAIVIAGAGAGKTLTILAKIKYLIEMNFCNPEEILVISFTNASVNDIKQKVKYNVNIFTFHKLAIFILEKTNYKYNLCDSELLKHVISESLKILDQQDQKIVLKFLNLNFNYSTFLNTNYFISFCKLIETFINYFKTNDYTFRDVFNKNYTPKEKRILLIIFNIYKNYIFEKRSTHSLDFDDLIIYAIKLVKYSKLNCKYIIIDEFQDTSIIRLKLIKEISNFTKSNIIVVGDDWQSIYRFSGCDLNIFINFANYFKNTKEIKLLNTYRNSQELITIASKFILKNPLQLQKNLKSNKFNKQPIIFVPYNNEKLVLKQILKQLTDCEDILILVRNNKDIYKYIDNEFYYANDTLVFKDKNLKCLTVHKSKGLEAKYVIILNCNDEILGFPNKIENNILIDKLNPSSEIKYAEERRLFYVAITRCKEQTYILYKKNNPSIFIKELKRIVKKINF